MQAWMLHAYSVYSAPDKSHPGNYYYKAQDNLWARREQLNAYTRALFALAEHNFDKADRAKTLVENLENGVKRDEHPDTSVLIGGNIQQPTSNIQQPIIGTAHWGEDGIYWRWSDSDVESTTFALRALLAIDPTNALNEPKNKKKNKNHQKTQKNNTHDTTNTEHALND